MDNENILPAFKRHRRHPDEILVINSSPREEAQRIHDVFKSELDSKPELQEESDYSNLSTDYKDLGEEAAYQLGHSGKSSRDKRIQQNEQDIKELKADNKELKAKVNAHEQRIENLETDVAGLKGWMAKPCLGTFLEVSFKKLMEIQDSPSFSINDAINSANEADVRRKTGMALTKWKEMLLFLKSFPGRNDTIHHMLPPEAHVQASISFCGDKMKMKTVAFKAFAELQIKMFP